MNTKVDTKVVDVPEPAIEPVVALLGDILSELMTLNEKIAALESRFKGIGIFGRR